MSKAEIVLESGSGKDKVTDKVPANIQKLALEACDLKDSVDAANKRLKEIEEKLIEAYKPANDGVRMEGVVIVVPERYRIAVSERESRSVEDMDKLQKVLGDRTDDLIEVIPESCKPTKKLYEMAADPDSKFFKKLQGVVQFTYTYVVGYRVAK